MKKKKEIRNINEHIIITTTKWKRLMEIICKIFSQFSFKLTKNNSIFNFFFFSFYFCAFSSNDKIVKGNFIKDIFPVFSFPISNSIKT